MRSFSRATSAEAIGWWPMGTQEAALQVDGIWPSNTSGASRASGSWTHTHRDNRRQHVNTQRIAELATFIETQTAIPFEFMERGSCIMAFIEHMEGVPVQSMDESALMSALDIDTTTAERLFYAGHLHSTRENAVTVLRHLADSGEVEWPWPPVPAEDKVGDGEAVPA